MAANPQDVRSLIGQKYEAGFHTDIEQEHLPPGLSEDTVRFISARKGQRSLGRDFGFVWPLRSLTVGGAATWIGAGAALSIVANLMLAPIASLAHG